jgi:hypothetical protein
LPLEVILRIERGAAYTSIRIPSIFKLCHALGVDAGDFTDTLMDYEKGKPND